MSDQDKSTREPVNQEKVQANNQGSNAGPRQSLREKVLSSLKYHNQSTDTDDINTNPYSEDSSEIQQQLSGNKGQKRESVFKSNGSDNSQVNGYGDEKKSDQNTPYTPFLKTSQLEDKQKYELNDHQATREQLSAGEENPENSNYHRHEDEKHQEINGKVSQKELERMRRRSERKKENKLVGKIVLAVITALVVTVTIVGVSFYRYWQAGLKPLDPTDDQLVQVNIPIGSSNKSIGSILEEEKIIKSGMVFTYYMKTENITDFKAGYYQMSPNMTLDEIAVLLQQGGTKEPEALADARISIPEGYSADQIAELFAEKTKIKKKEFLDTLKDEAFFEELYQDYGQLLESAKKAENVRYRLEGYLFPATYNYYKEKSVKDMIREMVDKTNSELAERQESIDQSGMTIQQVLTLASLVEKEGVEKEDRRNIAQVFLNRINADMPLQSDISVLYAMEKHKVHLSNKDTEIDSPYNLYINKGFGPGPFNNPGIEAIDAVLNPEPNTYYYFLANIETHKVYFAETYEEHLQLKEEHIDNQTEE